MMRRTTRTQRGMERLLRFLLLVVLVALTCNSKSTTILMVQAYRVGDAVDTDLVTGSSLVGWGPSYQTHSVLRSQMPLFGLDSTSRLTLEEYEMTKSFSLAFEDGLWTMPTVATLKAHDGAIEGLRSIHVSFGYSKSGAGAIHSVSTTLDYAPHYNGHSFRVRYQWLEEPDVSVTAGQSVMFFAVFVAGVVFALTSCGLFDDDDDDNDMKRARGTENSSLSSSSVPKWD